jgi:RNA polymerase sigma factor (sigma-70 family)
MIETTNKFWEETYHQNIKKMIGICYRYTYDSKLSEDLAHDAFVLAYQKEVSFKGKGPFEAWLRRITINVCLQHIRQRSKEKLVTDFLSNEAIIMESNDENSANEQYDFNHEELLEAISQLPEHHKLVFNLSVIDKFTHAQIGKELGISEGTSKSHLARARKKIRLLLTEKLNSEKGKKRASLLLFGFPIKLWDIDSLYRKQFKNYEIQNLRPYSPDTFTNAVQIPSIKAPFILQYLYPAIVTVGVGIGLVMYLNFENDMPISKTKNLNAVENATIIEAGDQILSKDQDSTATNIKNGIIVKDNKSLTRENDTMKNSKALAALLLASTTLTNSNGQTTKPDTALSNSKQTIIENKSQTVGPRYSRRQNIGIVEPIPHNASGTFYATSIVWSADDNKLYFNGKVIVDIGKNKFTGNGSFDVVGKIYYLLLDGKPLKLGSKADLHENKKYKLTQLSADKSAVKYGDVGKQGAIEIELAE